MIITSGLFKGRKLLTLKGGTTRPTSSRLRQALFNICQSYIADTQFLDLFAGSGAIGIEAISRGASKVIFIEGNSAAVKVIEKNIKMLGIENQCQIISKDALIALDGLDRQNQSFDLIYTDPPYHSPLTAKIIEKIETTSVLEPNGDFFLEEGDENLTSKLELISKRKAGTSFLYQWRKS